MPNNLSFCLVTGEELRKLISGTRGYLIFGKNELIFVDILNERIRKIRNCEPEAKRLYIFYSDKFGAVEWVKEDKVYQIIFGYEDKVLIVEYPNKTNTIEIEGSLLPIG
jgi:hypothetical protein